MENSEPIRLFADEIQGFLDHCQIEKGLSENTLEAYSRDLLDFEQFCKEYRLYSIQKIEDYNLTDYLKWLHDAKGLDETSAVRHRVSVRQFFRWMRGEEMIQHDPSINLTGERTKMAIPSVISPEQVENILRQPDRSKIRGIRDAAMLEVMYATGLRVSELVELQKENWKEDFLEVIGKGNKQRLVPLNLVSKQLVKEYRSQLGEASSSYLFLSTHKKPMSRQNFWMIIKKYVSAAGITENVSPHGLRHAFATHMLANGVNLRYLQEMLGHADIATTEIYTYVASTRLIEAHQQYHPRGIDSV